MKKGQITLFMILGLVIVIIIGLFFFLKSDIIKSALEKGVQTGIIIPQKIKSIYGFVEECITSTSNDALERIGKQGGYIIPTKDSTSLGIPYYINHNKTNIPSKEKIEKEIEKYINNQLPFCTKNFVDFPEFSVKQGEIESNTKIKENEVTINIKYPLEIEVEDKNYNLEKFKEISMPIRLGAIYNTAVEIVKEELKNFESVCLSCLTALGIENNLHIDIYPQDQDTMIFVITDRKIKRDEKNYEFIFAIDTYIKK